MPRCKHKLEEFKLGGTTNSKSKCKEFKIGESISSQLSLAEPKPEELKLGDHTKHEVQLRSRHSRVHSKEVEDIL